MSLTQIKRNPLIRRMNQIPVYKLYPSERVEDICDLIRKEETIEIIKSILYDMIDLIETNHNFEYVNHEEIPKKKNIFKRFLKKLFY
jgi:hypothetical protein